MRNEYCAMPVYRIYRLNEKRRHQFRWAPHASGVTDVKPKDYAEDGAVESSSPYAAWHQLRETDSPLALGDLLEDPAGKLYICKYVGFEEARWTMPDGSAAPAEGPAVCTPAAGD